MILRRADRSECPAEANVLGGACVVVMLYLAGKPHMLELSADEARGLAADLIGCAEFSDGRD